ncbi:hypothetical protein O3M35_006325 [Rhynocoris fuscipes]|uniref:Uncharacterized protein n=1 Tax=Rhynocoris fuscipes TaxID=488301 RepID=A0AAW1DEE9_9HEMI
MHNSKTVDRRILKFWIQDCSNIRMETSPFGYRGIFFLNRIKKYSLRAFQRCPTTGSNFH